MSSGDDRGQTREVFFRAWRAHLDGLPLAGVEKLIVQVLLQHPEYHSVLEQSETTRERDYHPDAGETNPFLHLGMHIAIVSTREESSAAKGRGHGFGLTYRHHQARFSVTHGKPAQRFPSLGLNAGRETGWDVAKGHEPRPSDSFESCARPDPNAFVSHG